MNLKTDLFTSIIAAIAGALIAFFVTNMFIGPIENVTYKKVDSSVSTDLPEPDPEVFNYRALNPTVEVYVGNCTEYDRFGECISTDTKAESKSENASYTPSSSTASETDNQETN